jgi:hypothetical protein
MWFSRPIEMQASNFNEFTGFAKETFGVGAVIQDALIALCGEKPITYNVMLVKGKEEKIVDSFLTFLAAQEFVLARLKKLKPGDTVEYDVVPRLRKSVN